MKKFFEKVITVVMMFAIAFAFMPIMPQSTADAADTALTFMQNNYAKAKKSYGKEFGGVCGDCVARQLKELGISTSSHNGKNWYKPLNEYASKGKKMSGYNVKMYSRADYGTIGAAVNQINQDGLLSKGDGSSIAVACFKTGSGSDAGQKYGHCLTIYKISGNYVWHTEVNSSGKKVTIEYFTRFSPASKCHAPGTYGERKNSKGKTLYSFQGIAVLYKDSAINNQTQPQGQTQPQEQSQPQGQTQPAQEETRTVPNTKTTENCVHQWDSGVEIIPVSCTEEGMIRFTCTLCGATEDCEAAPIGHMYLDETVIEESTCLTHGHSVSTCFFCGEEGETKELPLADHDYEEKIIKKATCTKSGSKKSICLTCGRETEVETVPALGHDFETTTVLPTMDEEGKIESKCTLCGKVESLETLPYVMSIDCDDLTYTGEPLTPEVIVTDSDENELAEGEDYNIAFDEGIIDYGDYQVTVSFDKDKFDIEDQIIDFSVLPEKVKLSKISTSNGKMTVSVNAEDKAVDGYVIQYSTSSKFKKGCKSATVKGTDTKKKEIKKLKAGTKYYVRVRSYVVVDDHKIYSNWSSKKSIKIK